MSDQRHDDALGDGFELFLVPGHLFGQLELHVQAVGFKVGGAEIASGIAQGFTPLGTETLIQGGVHLGACALEPGDGLIQVGVDLVELLGRQAGQLGGRHLGDVSWEDGQIVHDHLPHAITRSAVDSCNALYSKSRMTSSG